MVCRGVFRPLKNISDRPAARALNLAGRTAIVAAITRIGRLLTAGLLGIGTGHDRLLILFLHVADTQVVEMVHLGDGRVQRADELRRRRRRVGDALGVRDRRHRHIHRIHPGPQLGDVLRRLASAARSTRRPFTCTVSCWPGSRWMFA